MKRTIITGIALAALAVAPAMAQSNSNSGNASGTNAGTNGPERIQPIPNAQSSNGADRMAPSANTGRAQTASGLNESQARAKLKASGYSDVTGLAVGSDGMWHGRAMKGSSSTSVALDSQGNVIAR